MNKTQFWSLPKRFPAIFAENSFTSTHNIEALILVGFNSSTNYHYLEQNIIDRSLREGIVKNLQRKYL